MNFRVLRGANTVTLPPKFEDGKTLVIQRAHWLSASASGPRARLRLLLDIECVYEYVDQYEVYQFVYQFKVH